MAQPWVGGFPEEMAVIEAWAAVHVSLPPPRILTLFPRPLALGSCMGGKVGLLA